MDIVAEFQRALQKRMDEAIGDAVHFQDAVRVINIWLEPLGLWLCSAQFQWLVGGYDPKLAGRINLEQTFPTFPQALAFVLDEAQRRIADRIDHAQ